MKKIHKSLRTIKKHGLYPDAPVISSPHRPVITVNGKKALMFSSNNYLGLTSDPRVIAAARKGLEEWGIGTGGSRVATGNFDFHKTLENKIADFKAQDDALTFATGYMVNEGCIPPIMKTVDVSFSSLLKSKKSENEAVVFSDAYNHASIVIGVRLSGANKEIYEHNNMDDLESKLKKYSLKTRKLIVSDGVFSMDGDIVDLPRLLELAKKYRAMVYIDDAHSAGVLGKNGRGTEEYFGIKDKVDFTMGTFTKAFGGIGGYICSNKEAIDYLRVMAKSSVFTAPIAPPIAMGLIKSIEIAKKEKWRRDNILDSAEYLRNGLQEIGLNTMNSNTQIIPVFIGKELVCEKVRSELLANGFFVMAARWPAVESGKARLRVTVSSLHEKKHLDDLLCVMKKIKQKYKL